jgi:hypothetical protein
MTKKREVTRTDIISFRVSKEIYKKIKEFGEDELDEAGLPLNPSIAARRLMLEGLRAREKNRKT